MIIITTTSTVITDPEIPLGLSFRSLYFLDYLIYHCVFATPPVIAGLHSMSG